MRITETRLTPSRLELVRPLKTARATYSAREGFLVRLVDEAGRVGQSEAMPLPEFGTESPWSWHGWICPRSGGRSH